MTSSKRAAVIAEKVMGWRPNKEVPIWVGEDGLSVGYFRDSSSIIMPNTWRPDHNIAQAFEALEKWREGDGGFWDIVSPCDFEDEWVVTLFPRILNPYPRYRGAGASAPEAIVSALIEAVA